MNRRAFTLLGLRGAAALAALSVAPSLLASPASPASKFIGTGAEDWVYAVDKQCWLYTQFRTMFGRDYYVSDFVENGPDEISEAELAFVRKNAQVAFKRVAREHMAGAK